MHFYSLYKWENIVENSPHPQTRNEWLFKYGAFGRLNGLWFPCRIQNFTTIGEPATVVVVKIATQNQSIYPNTTIPVSEMDVLYFITSSPSPRKPYGFSFFFFSFSE